MNTYEKHRGWGVMVNQDSTAIPQRDVAADVAAAFRSRRLCDDEMVYGEADHLPLSLSHALQHRMTR